MKRTTPQPIGHILKDVVEKLSRTKGRDINKVISNWSSIAGRELSRHSRPAQLRKGTLMINVDDSAWFYQASLQKERLLGQLQQKIGEKKIKRIQFRIGKVN